MSQILAWHEWICHTNFSFCIGASHPEEYVIKAQQLGYRSLGICDYDGLYGIVRAYRQQQKMELAPQIFYGAEVHLAPDHDRPIPYRDTIILYALNHNGYKKLCSLISKAHTDNKKKAILSLETLLAIPSQDLICLQPMRGLIRHATANIIEQRYSLLKDHFRENFYLIISRHLNPLEDRWIEHTQHLSNKLKLPLLFSQDTYFHEEERKELCDIIQAIRLNKSIDRVVPHLFINSERCLRPIKILEQRYLSFPDAKSIVHRSQELSERFNFSLKELRYHYPQEFIPQGYSASSYLEEISWKSAMKRYQNLIPQSIQSLLQKELRLVKELDFADYFLTVWDIVRWARSQGILCQGRGSAANSAICFVLGITAVNPSEFDVLFERFISKERGDPPDIDVDFEHERREEVIQYIYRRYGRTRAAMVANVVSFRRRSAIKAVGKAFGIEPSFLEQISSQPKRSYSTTRQTILSAKILRQLPKNSENSTVLQEENFDMYLSFAETLEGFPRHISIHSGGFIITQDAINCFCAQEPATMEGRTVIQWAKDDIEFLQFFKIDILALGMLTALRKALELIQKHHGNQMDLADIPRDDMATYRMIQKAETVGTFQIESRAQMAMLPRLKPRNLYDLVIQIGIIRPGPIQGGLIHPYLRRRQGLEPVHYPDARLKPILHRTLGVPIFQEQIMRIAISVGDFSPGEADQLRKHIGAWSLDKEWGPLVQKLEDGMKRNGVAPQIIQSIMSHLKGFANYGFPESHAVSFALIAYASSYLKCHYKEAFYTALLNSQPLGFYSVHALIQSARREGCSFLPIDINSSDWDCKLEIHYDDKEELHIFIRLGLRLIKSLSKNTAEKISSARQDSIPWTSISHLQKSVFVPSHELVALAAADVFSCFGISRPDAIWSAIAGESAPLLESEEYFSLPEESSLHKVEQDFAHFSTTLELHPCQIIRAHHWIYSIPPSQITLAKDIASKTNHIKIFVFGLLLMRQQPPTAKGMVFITLEDETGLVNLALTPEVSRKFDQLLQKQSFLCIRGKLQKQQESHSILVDLVYPQDLKPKNVLSIFPKNSSTSMQNRKNKNKRLTNARAAFLSQELQHR